MAVTNYPLVTGVGASGGGDSVLSYANVGAFPVTGAVGYVYIDEANADMYLWTGAVYELQGGGVSYVGFWSQFPSANFLNYFILESDFGLSIPPWSQATSGAGSSVNNANGLGGVNGTEKAVGTTRYIMGATAPSLVYSGAMGQNGGSLRFTEHELIFGSRLYIETLSDATNNFTIWIGFANVYTAAPTQGVFFRYNHGVNGGRWEYVSDTTAADTGVAPTAGVYQVFEIVINRAGNEAKFYIDGSLVGTVSGTLTNLASMFAGQWGRTTASAATREFYVDANYLAIERLAAR